ncbi:hypothetical protein [Paraburkholderia sp. RL17-337-BIB-A]|uniref:hypothetical protein n=1 Tax=Paraburkholderia sp. RL17-337-BIB-A TaxID=3031636 RepID=UPI0038B90707
MKQEEPVGELTLTTGGKLEYFHWVSDEVTGDGAYVPSDVTDTADAYMMEPVRFGSEIYVRDIFSLLDRNPVLVGIFKRVYAAEYLGESKKGNAVPYTGEYDPEDIEYLELFCNWEKDSGTNEITGIHQLSLRGVGYELRDNIVSGGDKYVKGTRIDWGVAFSPLGQIFNLPLRFNSEVSVADSRNLSHSLHNFRVPSPTLAQVIHAVLWELAWAGNPDQTVEFVERIHEAAENMSGPTTTQEFSCLLGLSEEQMNRGPKKSESP